MTKDDERFRHLIHSIIHYKLYIINYFFAKIVILDGIINKELQKLNNHYPFLSNSTFFITFAPQLTLEKNAETCHIAGPYGCGKDREVSDDG